MIPAYQDQDTEKKENTANNREHAPNDAGAGEPAAKRRASKGKIRAPERVGRPAAASGISVTIPLVPRGDGTFGVARPADLAGCSEASIRRGILDALALQALGGSVDAARAWLSERRWIVEMKRGKAPSRLRLDQSLTVQVVDDLHGARAVRMAGSGPEIGGLAGRKVLPPAPRLDPASD